MFQFSLHVKLHQAKFAILDENAPGEHIVILRPFVNYMKQHVKICEDGIKALNTCSEDLKVLKGKIRSKAGQHDDRLQAIDVGTRLMDTLVEDVLHSIACAEQIEDEEQAKQHNQTLEKFVIELSSCKDTNVEISSKSKNYFNSL